MGIDINSILSSAKQMQSSCNGVPAASNVLDNTDPAAILHIQSKIDLEKTLFIVASKSGNTEETLSFFHYFYQRG
jgi:glucose-6-phosphate isomerase